MKTKAWLADLRVRSTFSDGSLSIPELVDFYGHRGFGAIAITDQIRDTISLRGRAARTFNFSLTEATFALYLEILRSEARRAWDLYGMVLIPGFEIVKKSTSLGPSVHLIGLGVRDYLSADGEIAATARGLRSQGALVIAGPRTPLSGSVIRFDAWEAAAGPSISEQVLRSGLPVIASSALRKKSDMSSWKTSFSCEQSEADVLEAIRRQDLSLQFYREADHNVDFGRKLGRALGGVGRARHFRNLPSLASLSLGSGS